MKNRIKNNMPAFIVSVLYVLFSAVQSTCLVFGGDDLWWARLDSPAELFGGQDINGRYVTNLLTYAITHSFLLRAVCGTLLLSGIFILMTLMLRRKGVDTFWAVFFSAAANFALPKPIAYLTTNWISGITNYVLSIVLTFIFLYLCKPLLYGENRKQSQLIGILTMVLGFMSAFCLENVTIYNGVFGVFIIVYYWIRCKKVHFVHIGYLVGTAAGLVVMMLNKNYSSIIGEKKDEIGSRYVEFGFSEIIQSLYSEVIPYFAKPFYLVHVCIALCLTILFFHKFGSVKNTGKHKYAKYCLVCVILYAMYSFLIINEMDLAILNMNYRIRAIETAFTFLYIISAVYIAYCLLEKDSFLRFTLYISSSIMVTAPFLVVNPVTARCFYATFIFWCMAAGEVFIEVVRTLKVKKSELAKYLSICFIGGFTLFFSYINISNKFIDTLRNNYIVEQIESKSRVIEVMDLPYPEYAVDSTYSILSSETEVDFSLNEKYIDYKPLQMYYLGYDMTTEEIDKFKYLEISTIDYYSTHASE